MEQGWVIALSKIFKNSKPMLKDKNNILADNQADDKSQAKESAKASKRLHAKQSNGQICAKDVEGNGNSSEFDKDTKPGGRTKSIPCGSLTRRSVHPTSPILPTRNNQPRTPIHSKSSLKQIPCVTNEKYCSSREVYEDPKPGPCKEIILHELDGVIVRNTKDEVAQKYNSSGQHTKTSKGNQRYFYQTPSVFYIRHKSDDASKSVQFQDDDMTITLPNQVEYL